MQFTMEEEKDHKIGFLDVLFTRNDDRLGTSVYRKPTHTERYIPFHSNHHPKAITGVMRGMRDRAHRVCDPSSKPKELQHLDEVFQANGFPAHLVKKTLTASPKQPHTYLELTKPQGTLYTPYVHRLSERLERICTPLNIHNVFTTANTLKQVLMRVKSQLLEEKKGIMYY